MTVTATDNLGRARAYLEALERGDTGEALARFFAPEVVQQELPNRLVPQGTTRTLAAILEGAERGKKVMQRQRYEVHRSVVEGDRVVLEVTWTGTLAIPLGSLPAGGQMRAHFAVFLDFRDGRIVAQRNYDCFEPW